MDRHSIMNIVSWARIQLQHRMGWRSGGCRRRREKKTKQLFYELPNLRGLLVACVELALMLPACVALLLPPLRRDFFLS